METMTAEPGGMALNGISEAPARSRRPLAAAAQSHHHQQHHQLHQHQQLHQQLHHHHQYHQQTTGALRHWSGSGRLHCLCYVTGKSDVFFVSLRLFPYHIDILFG